MSIGPAVLALLGEFADEAAIYRRRAKSPIEQAAATRVEALLQRIRRRRECRGNPRLGREGSPERSGTKISSVDLAFIQAGRTTMAEVLRDFGEPAHRQNARREGSVFLYVFAESFASSGGEWEDGRGGGAYRRMVQTTRITFDARGIVAGVEASTGMSWRHGRSAH